MPKEVYDIAIIGSDLHALGAAFSASRRGLNTLLIDPMSKHDEQYREYFLGLFHGGLQFLPSLSLMKLFHARQRQEEVMKISIGHGRLLPFFTPVRRITLPAARVFRCLNKVFFREDNLIFPSFVTKSTLVNLIPQFKNYFPYGAFSWKDFVVSNVADLAQDISVQILKQGVTVFNANLIRATQDPARIFHIETNIGEFTSKYIINIHAPSNANFTIAGLQTSPLCHHFWCKIVHVILRSPLPFEGGVVLKTKTGRSFILFPHENNVILGTSFFPYYDTACKFKLTEEEGVSLVREFAESFPQCAFTSNDIISVVSGITPAASLSQKGIVPRNTCTIENHFGGQYMSVIPSQTGTFLDTGDAIVNLIPEMSR